MNDLERLARAIFFATDGIHLRRDMADRIWDRNDENVWIGNEDRHIECGECNGVIVPGREHYREAARQVLQELRNPSEGMVSNMLAALDERGRQVTRGYVGEDDAITAHQAMIDSVLAQEKV